MRVAVLASQTAQQVVRAVPVPARAVGDVDDAARARPRGARQAEIQRIAGRAPPPVVLVQVHAQKLAGHVHELEQILDAVFPVADALVAGAVGAQRIDGPPELVQGEADPQLGVFHLVEHGQPGNRQSAGVDPQMVLQVRPPPPRLARGGGFEHGRAAADDRLADRAASGLVQIGIAPVVDDPQTEQLVPGGQVHAVDPAQSPGLVAARSQRPRLSALQVLPLAGQHVGHRQHRHGVADFALPELLVAAVAVLFAVGRRATSNGPVGLRAKFFPQRMRASFGRPCEAQPLVPRQDTAADARPALLSSSAGRGSSRYCSMTLSRSIGSSEISSSRASISAGSLVPFSSASQNAAAFSGAWNSTRSSCHVPSRSCVVAVRVSPDRPCSAIGPRQIHT